MATKNRIFISFAIEDAIYRTFLVSQGKNEHSPFEFVDMSVKEPWDETWKTKCRSRIKGCDGVIALLEAEYGRCCGPVVGNENGKRRGHPDDWGLHC